MRETETDTEAEAEAEADEKSQWECVRDRKRGGGTHKGTESVTKTKKGSSTVVHWQREREKRHR